MNFFRFKNWIKLSFISEKHNLYMACLNAMEKSHWPSKWIKLSIRTKNSISHTIVWKLLNFKVFMYSKINEKYFYFYLFVFFCLLWWDLLDHASPSHVLGTVGKVSMRRGARTLFCDIPTYGRKDTVLNFEIFMSSKIRKLLLLLFWLWNIYEFQN